MPPAGCVTRFVEAVIGNGRSLCVCEWENQEYPYLVVRRVVADYLYTRSFKPARGWKCAVKELKSCRADSQRDMLTATAPSKLRIR